MSSDGKIATNLRNNHLLSADIDSVGGLQTEHPHQTDPASSMESCYWPKAVALACERVPCQRTIPMALQSKWQLQRTIKNHAWPDYKSGFEGCNPRSRISENF
jgi:hypothetical protein